MAVVFALTTIFVLFLFLFPHETQGSTTISALLLGNLKNGKFWLEFAHIALPITIIIVEAYTLNRMLREQHERLETTEALKSFRAAMGRESYLRQISAAISTAKREILFTSATMAPSWESPEQREIFETVFSRIGKESQTRSVYSHKGVIAKRPEAIPGIIELLCFTDVEIRLHPLLAMSRLRFLIKDCETCVMGIAEGNCGEVPSNISYAVQSAMLSLSLQAKFSELWDEGEDPWAYIDGFIKFVEPKDELNGAAGVLNWVGAHRHDKGVVIRMLRANCPSFDSLYIAAQSSGSPPFFSSPP